MGNIFDFSEIKKCEITIKKTWEEFREALSKGVFTYAEIEKAKEWTFLKVYDDLFNQHLGIEHETITIKDLQREKIGRGTILNDWETPNYERFIPKKEFIKEDNRFSPPGIEWLYLALGESDDIQKCAQLECRAEANNRFGFCYFEFNNKYENCKLVDLTVAIETTYAQLNQQLEEYGQSLVQREIKKVKTLWYVSRNNFYKEKFVKLLTKWCSYTYAKLLSEQIFVPLENSDNKSISYAPFQVMAQYYISLGFSGIVFGSTVCNVGKNIVLFDKNIAIPKGIIEDYII